MYWFYHHSHIYFTLTLFFAKVMQDEDNTK